MTSDSKEIKEHIVNFYKHLYSKQFMRPKLDGLSFLSIDMEERNWMEKEIEESVLEVVSWKKGSMTLGVFYGFFPKVLGGIKRRNYGSFKEFHRRGKFKKSFNATFVFLILKKIEAVGIKDFHLLSRCYVQNYF